MLIPVPGGDMVWQCHSPIQHLQDKGLTFDPVAGEASSSHAANKRSSTGGGGSPKQRCLKAFEDFPAMFRDVVKSTPESAITEHGLYQRTPEQIPDVAWGVGNITLVRPAVACGAGTGWG